MVPNDFHSLAIDYVKEQGYPVILVTSGKLGSINHTLLSLYACKLYKIPFRFSFLQEQHLLPLVLLLVAGIVMLPRRLVL